ncbi:Trp biosynthesis-associated membrane protein [Nocardioides yefusunii]|uniref:Trp biosynthesis-associated membrane protein n=1 Tax=Nocardioides yefusunii TaxID=2500546 RepID=A0ABW1QXC9_9ACTN|nr:Trp biosynthesis-associated membrane protein [Nocardioides yefusunii]
MPDQAPVDAPATTPTARRKDRTFGPSVLVGLVAAGMLAIAGNRDWVLFDVAEAQQGNVDIFTDAHPGLAQAPLAGALGLVALAGWGVLLVTRGWPRRVAAVLAALAPLGAVWVWLTSRSDIRDDVDAAIAAAGVTWPHEVVASTWATIALISAVVATLAAVVAVVRVGTWPAMGSRYDAPTAPVGAAARVAQAEDLSDADPTDLWKALDEGHDPT